MFFSSSGKILLAQTALGFFFLYIYLRKNFIATDSLFKKSKVKCNQRDGKQT